MLRRRRNIVGDENYKRVGNVLSFERNADVLEIPFRRSCTLESIPRPRRSCARIFKTAGILASTQRTRVNNTNLLFETHSATLADEKEKERERERRT